MPKKYLVGVGVVRGFVDNNLLFVGKTLIDTSMEISTSSTEIRGGQGNSLLAEYFHDSALNITITEAQFLLPVLALNVGITRSTMGGKIFGSEEITLVGSTGTLTNVTAAEIASVSGAAKNVYIEYDGEYYSLPVTGNTFDVSSTPIPANTTLCVAYLKNDANSETYIIPANYVPSRLHLYITVKLSGDSAGEGFIGEETIEIPIFQLSGSQTISMTADGVANTSLSGKAITFDDAGACESSGHYAKITETIYNKNWYDGTTALAISGGDFEMKVGENKTLRVYAIKGNTSFLVDNSQLTFESSDAYASVGANTGVVSADSAGDTLITAFITAKPTIEVSATLTVSG